MSYQRVIPRDLFNEGSLLKCYGRIYVLLENMNVLARFSEDDVSQFDVVQRDDDGAIFIENLPLLIGARHYRLTRPMNSRRAWPLYAERADDADFEPVDVFDEDGNFTDKMKVLLTA